MLQMRARGFALRDAFPDVLKGLITVEEANDYPDEAKPALRQPMRNPLDALAAPKEPETLPVQLDDINAQLTDATAEEVVADLEPVILEKAADDCGEETTLDPVGDWVLKIPGKDSVAYADYPSWSAAYEGMADKVFKADRLAPRTRMTKLRELKEANADTMQKISALEIIHHTAAYSKRLATLGAQIEGAAA
jgi:hypothetical protein